MRAADWTSHEVDTLRAGYAAGTPVAEIAAQLRRPYHSVKARAHKMGLWHSDSHRTARTDRHTPAQADIAHNATASGDDAASGPENGFARRAEKILTPLARQEAAANAIRVKRGEGDYPAHQYVIWTLEQATTLLRERQRGSSVEEIAHATGHTIPATYAKMKELERTCRRGV